HNFSVVYFFFFSSRRRHTRFSRDWSSDVCSSDLTPARRGDRGPPHPPPRRCAGRGSGGRIRRKNRAPPESERTETVGQRHVRVVLRREDLGREDRTVRGDGDTDAGRVPILFHVVGVFG